MKSSNILPQLTCYEKINGKTDAQKARKNIIANSHTVTWKRYGHYT